MPFICSFELSFESVRIYIPSLPELKIILHFTCLELCLARCMTGQRGNREGGGRGGGKGAGGGEIEWVERERAKGKMRE